MGTFAYAWATLRTVKAPSLSSEICLKPFMCETSRLYPCPVGGHNGGWGLTRLGTSALDLRSSRLIDKDRDHPAHSEKPQERGTAHDDHFALEGHRHFQGR